MSVQLPPLPSARPTHAIPCLRYADAPAAIAWLVDVLGAEARHVYPGPDGGVAHAELWFGDACVMLGSSKGDGTPPTRPGEGAVYVVAGAPAAVDARHARAAAAGARIVVRLHDTDYGSRDFGCADPEGNFWGFGSYAPAAHPAPAVAPTPANKEGVVTAHASGPFDVQLKPMPTYETAEGAMLGRMSIDKQFHGGLEATSRGEMLSAGTAVTGSAAYSAVERVSGTLAGRRGTFVLQHTGVMTRGVPSLVITVVPDSGTGELAGLAGTMAIQVEGGKHSYTFEYSLPGAAGPAAP